MSPDTKVDHCIIVGAGNVVAKRLLPALMRATFSDRYTILHDGKNDIQHCEPEFPPVVTRELTTVEIKERLSECQPTVVFVATPPDPRAAYCEEALKAGHLVIAEKPLAVIPQGIARFQALGNQSNRLFALSYYVLEKALPWTWLLRPKNEWRRHLHFSDLISGQKASDAFRRMGPLQSLHINICEGAEYDAKPGERFWYQDQKNGVWFDMGVHVLMLAMISGIDSDALRDISVKKIGIDQFELAATSGDPQFTACFGKHFPHGQTGRNLTAQFRNGSVFCNFNSASCSLIEENEEPITVSTAYHSMKYRTLVGQVITFVESDGWKPISNRCDLFSVQLDALSILAARASE